MTTLLQTIRILVTVLLIEKTRCQDVFNNGDNILGYQQIASNDGQIETITSYSTNIVQRDPSSESISTVNVQYHITDDKNKNIDYNRAGRGRSKKVYRIKNPFHHQLEDVGKNEESTDHHDSGSAASNQYAAVQYSLPPEEFFQQMRSENQYYQQQQQLTTPAPNLGYSATPQPQYQYSSASTSNYDINNQQSNQFQLEPKLSQAQTYLSNSNYQFGPTNTFGLKVVQSTPSPINSYFSTSLPNYYLNTPGNPYVSSSSPIFLSNTPNLQSYVSSSLSPIQTSPPDYNNHISSTIGGISPHFDNSDSNKNMQLDHYDNSVNGIRYPVSTQPQYTNSYPSSTSLPHSTSYSNLVQDNWQNTLNAGVHALSKSLQEISLSQLQSYPYKNNQQETRTDNNLINTNSDTHRMGSLPSANNIYLNYVQPDYQASSNLKIRSKDPQQNSNQQGLYSNGDYGWKLNDKNTLSSQDSYSTGNYPKYSGTSSQSDGEAISQMNFHMDTGKSYISDPHTRTYSENDAAREFIKSATKAQEKLRLQQQQFYNNNYPSNIIGNNQQGQNQVGNIFYGNDDNKKNKHTDESNPTIYSFSSSPPELITGSPYYYINTRDITVDNKPKLSFDHAKALQNIVPIDVSNVVSNTDVQSKSITGLENNNRYNIGKEHSDQNIKQYYRTLAEPFYKDKNTLYEFNIKTKPEDFLALDYLRPIELNTPYSGKQHQSQEHNFSPNSISGTSQSYTPQVSSIYQDNMQSPASFQQQELQRPQNQLPSDIAGVLKLNDVPQRLTQGLTSDSLRLYNQNLDQGGVPSSLPVRLNQNLGSHQLDVSANILSKLMPNKQLGGSFNKPEYDAISTINGFKVANPFNVDLRLVAEMLKGKTTIDETYMHALKDKLAPLKLDLSQLQHLLRNENSGNLTPLSDSFSAYSNPYIDLYGSVQYPYQGIKYSRSQEEEESMIPITDTSNTHPIGAVVEQVDTESELDITSGSDVTAPVDVGGTTNLEDNRSMKSLFSNSKGIGDRPRHPNGLLSGRQSYQKKYHIEEPYRLLKPPPPQPIRHRGNNMKIDKHSRRRRRMNRPRIFRVLKPEPLFEDESDVEYVEPTIPILLRPPPSNAENKSDTVNQGQGL